MTDAELQRRRDRIARLEAHRPGPGVDVDYARNENRLEAAADVLADVLAELLDAKASRDR